jgi:hypothetical protein
MTLTAPLTAVLLAAAAFGIAGCQQTPAPAPAAVSSSPAQQLSPAEEFAAVAAGMTESEAQAGADAAGLTLRVVSRDGEPLPATMDYRLDRVNVALVDGVVTEASVG